jgi:drug/metabolite transporter (DMT)-like permease
MEQKQVSARLLTGGMILSMFLWGLSGPSGKVLSGYCSVVNFSVYRYFLVVPTLAILLPALGMSYRIKKGGIGVVLISGLLLAAYSYLFFMGIKLGAAGAGGVLVTIMNPIMAYTIGIVLSRRLPSRFESLGLLLGILAGSILLKMWDATSAIFDSGNIYFLLAAFTWAVMSKFTAKGGRYGSSLGFSLWQYIITLLCLLPFTNVAEMRAAVHIADPVFWFNLFFSSVIVTAGATTMYFFTTTRLGAEKASSFIFMVPLAAALSSWLFIGEQIHLHTAVGGLLGIAAVYIMNRKSSKSTQEIIPEKA